MSDTAQQTGTEGKNTYEIVWGILLISTLLEFIIASQIGNLDLAVIITILLTLTAIKALLVALYFMGIKYEKNRLLIFAIAFGLPLFLASPIALIPILG